MKKKKLLILIPSLIGGGAERTLINLLNLLTMEDLEINLVSVLRKGPYLNQIPTHVKFTYLTKNELLLKFITKIHQKFNFFYPLKKLFTRKVKGNFDVGISFLDCIYTEFLHIQSKDIQIKRKITWVHSCYKSYNNFVKFYKDKKYNNRLRKTRYSKLDMIVFVSNDSKKEFIDLFGEFPNMQVIYNPINNDKIIRKARELRCNSRNKGTFTFIAIGSLIPVKNYTLLIEATRLLAQKINDFEVHIYGTCYLKNELLSLINSYNLSKHIFLKGFVENPYPCLNAADAFIMTSLTEALPTALIEAMVFGKPVIATNVSGCREVLDGGNYGLLTDLDPDSVAANMYLLYSDKESYNYYCHLSFIRSRHFDDNIFLEKFIHVINYEDIAN